MGCQGCPCRVLEGNIDSPQAQKSKVRKRSEHDEPVVLLANECDGPNWLPRCVWMASTKDDHGGPTRTASILYLSWSHSPRTAMLDLPLRANRSRTGVKVVYPSEAYSRLNLPEQRFPDPSLVTTKATVAATAVSRLHDHKPRTTARCRVRSLEADENRIVHR